MVEGTPLDPNVAIAASSAFIGVMTGTLAIALFWQLRQDQKRATVMTRQLAEVKNAGAGAAVDGGLLRSQREESVEPLAELARRFGWSAAIESKLVQAGMKWDIGTFMVLTLGATLGPLMALLLLTGEPLLALPIASVCGLAPWAYIRFKANRRLNAFEEALPEALDLLARAIRAGHPIASGIKIVADEAPQPVAGEFQRTFEEQRFGLPFEDAMIALAGRMPLVDLRMLVTALLIQREVGGNLAEVLDNLGEVIRQRFVVRRQLRTYTAQGRLSGYVLAALPIFVGGAILLINPEYGQLLFHHPLGKMLLGIAITMQLMGFFWIRRIVDIEI
ncbi:MAG: type II secretion system F family protein [Gemmatimonadales bacterium]